jgi:hypothetical protein
VTRTSLTVPPAFTKLAQPELYLVYSLTGRQLAALRFFCLGSVLYWRAMRWTHCVARSILGQSRIWTLGIM